MCRSPSETYSVSSISPGQNAVSHHQIPELSPLSRPLSESSDLPGIRCALAATRHLLEMYRRQLQDEKASRKLQRLDKRLQRRL